MRCETRGIPTGNLVLHRKHFRPLLFAQLNGNAPQCRLWKPHIFKTAMLDSSMPFQQAHDVRTMLYGRWYDVNFLKWRRRSNIVLTSCTHIPQSGHDPGMDLERAATSTKESLKHIFCSISQIICTIYVPFSSRVCSTLGWESLRNLR